MTLTVDLRPEDVASTIPAETSEVMRVVAVAAEPLARPKAPETTPTETASLPTAEMDRLPAVRLTSSPTLALTLVFVVPRPKAAPTPIRPPATALERIRCSSLPVAEITALPLITSVAPASMPAAT